MEEEIANILMTSIRSIVDQGSARAILKRVLVLRNAFVLRMDWSNVHSPQLVSTHLLSLIRTEFCAEKRLMMAGVCDLVFSTVTGQNSFFTNYFEFSELPQSFTYAVGMPCGPIEHV
jgi:hypothetical protein